MGVVHRAAVAKPTVRPPRIVVDAEVLDDDPCLGERPELFAVEALIAEAAVEGLHEAVLPRTGWLDVDGPDLLRRQPSPELMGDKLRAVVGANELRGAMLRDGLLHQGNHIGRLQGPVGPEHMALARVLI